MCQLYAFKFLLIIALDLSGLSPISNQPFAGSTKNTIGMRILPVHDLSVTVYGHTRFRQTVSHGGVATVLRETFFTS